MSDRGAQLKALQEARKQAAFYKTEAERLKTQILADGFAQEGSVVFLDADGHKRSAYYGTSERIQPDLTALAAEMGQEFVDPLLQTSVNTEALRAALDKGLIPPDVAARTLKMETYGATVRFNDPDDAASSPQ
jgi:hypothetical protein